MYFLTIDKPFPSDMSFQHVMSNKYTLIRGFREMSYKITLKTTVILSMFQMEDVHIKMQYLKSYSSTYIHVCRPGKRIPAGDFMVESPWFHLFILFYFIETYLYRIK